MYSSLKVGRSKFVGLAAAAALAGSIATQVRAIAPIGDNGELFVTGTASATYNSNVLLSSGAPTEDLIWDFIPGLSYEFGKVNSLTTGQLAANEDFVLFTKHETALGNQLFNGTFWTKYDDSKTKLSFDASYHQLDQPTVTARTDGGLIDRDVSHIDAIGEVQFTDKSSVGTGLIWDDTNYTTAGYTDWRYFEIPVNVYYKFEPKLDLSAGFQFQDNTLGARGRDSNDYFVNVGARGEFSPNLTGTFRVGYIEQDFDGGSHIGGVGLDSSFTYAYSAKSNVTFGATDDFGYAAIGSSYRNFGVYLGGATALTEQWSANAQIAFNRYSYVTTTERDNFITGRVGLTYIMSTNITVSGYYSYSKDDGQGGGANFRQNLLSVSTSLHF
jgi:hypothetical protein